MTKHLYKTSETSLNYTNKLKLISLSEMIAVYNNSVNAVVNHILKHHIKKIDARNIDILPNNLICSFKMDIIRDSYVRAIKHLKSGALYRGKQYKNNKMSMDLHTSMYDIVLTPEQTTFKQWIRIKSPIIGGGHIMIPFHTNKNIRAIERDIRNKKINLLRILFRNDTYVVQFIYQQKLETIHNINKDVVEVDITEFLKTTETKIKSLKTKELYEKKRLATTKEERIRITKDINKEHKNIINSIIKQFTDEHEGKHIVEKSTNLKIYKMIRTRNQAWYLLRKNNFNYFITTLIRKLQEERFSFCFPTLNVNSLCNTTASSVV